MIVYNDEQEKRGILFSLFDFFEWTAEVQRRLSDEWEMVGYNGRYDPGPNPIDSSANRCQLASNAEQLSSAIWHWSTVIR